MMIFCNNNRLLVPEDVVIEILSYLPAESLMRFKCVRKSWYALIQEDSNFVAMQLQNHREILFLALKEGINFSIKPKLLSVLKYDGQVFSSHATIRDVNLSIYNDPGVLLPGVSGVCGPCDGIVCFCDYADCVIVANPGIRQYRALPKTSVPPPPNDDWNNCPRTDALGFDIDLQAKEYKLVRILSYVDGYGSTGPKYTGSRYDVEVYSFGSNNSWRQIRDACLLDWQTHPYSLSCYWNGACYWSAHAWDVNGFSSFHFSDEEFEFIPIPEYVLLLSNGSYEITEFNGALSLIICHCLGMDYYFDIWVMDGCGATTTWTKLLSSKPQLFDGDVLTPLGVTKNNQLFMWLTNQQLASYSFVTNEMKILPVHCDISGYECGICFVGYKTSLVSINIGINNG